MTGRVWLLAGLTAVVAACGPRHDGPDAAPPVPGPLPSTAMATLWDELATFDEFLADSASWHGEWKRSYDWATVREDFEARASVLPGTKRLVAIVAEECVDCVGTVPYVVRLGERVPQLETRVVRREDAELLLRRYGRLAPGDPLPAVIVLDDAFQEVGCRLGVPPAARAWQVEQARRPGPGFTRAILNWYETDRGAAILSQVVARLESAQRGEVVCP